ncbi:hypothetical protein E4T56_gene12627 [Termitomyces sp. T112]|nr:hypothetical protein E4T56_gene12627 [Termitomyces sp. T112]
MVDGLYTMRPGSSSSSMTSSLTGAIGDSVHRSSRSPSMRNDGLLPSPIWSSSQPAMLQGIPHSSYQGVTGMNSLTYDMSVNNLDFDSTTMRGSSPESNSSGSPNFGNTIFEPYSQHGLRHSGSNYSLPTQPLHPSISAEDQLKAELITLRQRLREVEAETARYRIALEQMHAKELAPKPLCLPTPPPSATFQEDWKLRTEIRKKMFCSLNRAGNALCAWHDSRRERRSFPPRNAPPGYLNCGCTHEEALFEESLSRHGVGSYYPGESVRMDPALRNPLLRLLQQRYGYQDGDFERNGLTGEWLKGEGAAYWQSQIHAGSSSRRRVEMDRH